MTVGCIALILLEGKADRAITPPRGHFLVENIIGSPCLSSGRCPSVRGANEAVGVGSVGGEQKTDRQSHLLPPKNGARARASFYIDHCANSRLSA
jgi:hypothetical protein